MGTRFARVAFLNGGWERLNAAFRRDTDGIDGFFSGSVRRGNEQIDLGIHSYMAFLCLHLLLLLFVLQLGRKTKSCLHTRQIKVFIVIGRV